MSALQKAEQKLKAARREYETAKRISDKAERKRDNAYQKYEYLLWKKEFEKQVAKDRATQTIIKFNNQEYVLHIEMLYLRPEGWRFRFFPIGQRNECFITDACEPDYELYSLGERNWEWTPENKTILLDALKNGSGMYFSWSYEHLSGE